MSPIQRYAIRFFAFFLFLSFFSSAASADETSFYTLNERWQKSASAPETKASALDKAFAAAISGRSSGPVSAAFAPPNLTRTLSDVVSAGGSVEIEQGQALFLKTGTPVVKFLATDEGIVTLETSEASTLLITGRQVGSTFVHVWDEGGRKTFSLRVTQPKVQPNPYLEKQAEVYEKTRPFKFYYDNNRGAFYTGDKYKESRRSSYDFTQQAGFLGDTPYGELSGHMQTQNDRGRAFMTDTQVALRDGQVGKLDNFDVALGDSRVAPNFFVFPQARVRGAALEHWDDGERLRLTTFRGREEASIVGTLTPGVVSERSRDSFLTGEMMDYKVNEDARLRAGYFQGSGRDRFSTSTKEGAAGELTTQLGPHTVFKSEVDHDMERFAQKHAFVTSFEKLYVKNEVRDVSRNFRSLLGVPSRQGEIGYLLDYGASPTRWWSIRGYYDIFRDRLIFNPDDPTAPNRHFDISTTFLTSDVSSLTFSAQDFDDTGRIGPTRLRVYAAQYNQKIDLLGHRATVFSRYQYRRNASLTNALSTYRQDQFTLGLYTELFWGIYFSTQKEWSALYEPELNRTTHPSTTTYSLDWQRQLSDLPVYLDAHLRLRDEEETESFNSFLAGEDSAEVAGGVRYKPSEDLEVFLNGSFTQYVPENRATAPSQRIEMQFLTGMSYVYDTGWRWQAAGSFQGYVYKDVNGDGRRDAGEPGLPGMPVVSSDGQKTVTNADGLYELKNVRGKRVAISLDNSKIPYGYAPTSSLRQEADILPNKTSQLDFGLTPRSEISGVVFNDLNGNGKYDQDEPGVRKIKIELEDGQATRSNAIGSYSFPTVTAGEHTATLVLASLPEGYLPLEAPKKKFTTFEGIRFDLNFPLRAVRQVSGRAFLDVDKNGVLDAKDRPQSGIRMKLGGKTVVTEEGGWYLFDEMTPGTYRLEADPSTLEPGWTAPPPAEVTIPAEPVTIRDLNAAIAPG